MANVQWQMGNNRTLALQLSLHDEVVLVEVVDCGRPIPSPCPSSSTSSTAPSRRWVPLSSSAIASRNSHRTSHPRRIAEPPRAPGDRHELGGGLPAPRDDDGAGAFDADAYVDSAAATRPAASDGEGAGAGANVSSSAPRRLRPSRRRARRERRHGRVRTQRRRHGDVRHVGVDGENNTVALNMDIPSFSPRRGRRRMPRLVPERASEKPLFASRLYVPPRATSHL